MLPSTTCLGNGLGDRVALFLCDGRALLLSHCAALLLVDSGALLGGGHVIDRLAYGARVLLGLVGVGPGIVALIFEFGRLFLMVNSW